MQVNVSSMPLCTHRRAVREAVALYLNRRQWPFTALNLKKGDLDGAIADATRAIEIEPKLLQAYVLRDAIRHCLLGRM